MLAAIGRTLIPRYFRSIFEGGVTELYYNLKHPKESFHNTSITLDCDNCVMVTHHGKPMFTKVRGIAVRTSETAIYLFNAGQFFPFLVPSLSYLDSFFAFVVSIVEFV